MAKTIRVEERFKKLAELLVQIMVEGDFIEDILFIEGKEEGTPFDPKISKAVVRKTALSLQRGYNAGEFKEDAKGGCTILV